MRQMKKFLLALFACLFLTGCSSSADSSDATVQTTVPDPTVLLVYTPDDMAEGLVKTEASVSAITENTVTEQLILAGVLAEGTQVNTLEIVSVSDAPEQLQLRVDFNAPFRDRLLSQGTAGEYVTLGSVVNTFLTAYHAQSMVITVEGGTLESGHAVYDAPFVFFDPE